LRKHEGMKIPKAFWLHGQRIEIVYDKLLGTMQGNRGEARYGYNEIRLLPIVEGDPQPKSKIDQAFFHELTHLILDHMEKDELSKDEAFVNLFASLLHQALTTAEYD